MRLRRLVPALVLAGSTVATSFAHEPLWGETPTIFGPGVFHPEIRLGYMHPGDTRIFEQEYGLQYGINRLVNVRLVLPGVRMDFDQSDGSAGGESRVGGIGDAVLSAKYRFHLRQDTGMQSSQALVFGWKAPTGDDERDGPDGSRLMPAEQPGTGSHGLELGYAVDHERLVDSAWLSVFYLHEFARGLRRGDQVELDAAYGRWIARPNVADDLGVNLAFGMHAEAAASDQLDDGLSAGNRHQMIGLHVTPIVTRGRSQYRAGLLVPVWKGGDREAAGLEVRAGWEIFF